MKPADLKAWLAVLPANTAAVEIDAEGGAIKLQFFAPMTLPAQLEPRIPTEPPAEERGPAAPSPDATMLALMAQNGRA